MMNDPILASAQLPAGTYGYRVPLMFYVHGGLHYLKGNPSPHFSLTAWYHRKGFPEQCQGGGAAHEMILKRYPRFADLAALHLSDLDGAPMHAESNGWYNLAGALGGMGERYTVLDSQRHFPKAERDPAKPWSDTDWRKPTKAEALQIFADFCRIPLDEARDLAARVLFNDSPRDVWRAFVETLRPRWKEQAEACIAAHDLRLYGDVAAWEERKAAVAGIAAVARGAA